MNIEANEKKDKSSIGRHVKRASLYLVPGYPIYKAIKSAKETAVGGADTVRDLVAELEMRKPKTRVIRPTARHLRCAHLNPCHLG